MMQKFLWISFLWVELFPDIIHENEEDHNTKYGNENFETSEEIITDILHFSNLD
jgi:hypothetical protein